MKDETTSETTETPVAPVAEVSRKNPHQKGNLKSLFDWMKGHGARQFTRTQFVEYAESLGIGTKSAQGLVNALLSPRETGKGDVRGNYSVAGHLYFLEVIKKKPQMVETANGKWKLMAQERAFKFHWREVPLEQRKAVKKSSKRVQEVNPEVVPVSSPVTNKENTDEGVINPNV